MSLVSSILGDPEDEPPFGQQPSVTQRRAVWTFQLEKESKGSGPTILSTKPCRRVPKKIHDYLLIVNMPLILLLTFHYKYHVSYSFLHNQLFPRIQSCQYFHRN